MKRVSLVIVGLLFLALPGLALPETAVYSATFTAPQCTSGLSPCEVPASLIDSRGLLDYGTGNNAEWHQPNTLTASACADGRIGTHHFDQSLDDFTVSVLAGSAFKPDSAVQVDATVWCYDDSGMPTPLDVLYVYQADDASSPSWNYMGSDTCYGKGVELQTLSVTFALGSVAGDQAIRVAFTYNSSAASCDP